jgi:hypothetical protein
MRIMRQNVRTRFPVDGAGKIELFDIRGRVIERVPFTNFVAPEGLAHNRWQVRQDFHEGMPGSNMLDPETTYPFSNVLLTDADEVENPSETWPLGTPIGWSNKTLYSGADTMRGTPNADECAADLDSVTWVFDWATNSAVGTIQSVIWCPLISGTNTVWTSLRSTELGWSKLYSDRGQGDSSVQLGGLAVNSSGHLWAIMRVNGSGVGSGNRMLLLDRNSGATLISGPTMSGLGYSSTSSTPLPLAIDSTHMYSSHLGLLHKYTIPVDATAPVKTTLPTPGGETAITGLTCDATHLWVLGASDTLYRIDKTTGAIDRQFTPTLYAGESITSVAFNSVDGLLYVGGYTGSQVVSLFRPVVRRYTIDGDPVGTSSLTAFTGTEAIVACDDAGILLVADSSANFSVREVDTAVDGVMGTRARLSAPIVKSSVQTMKLTYTFTFA